MRVTKWACKTSQINNLKNKCQSAIDGGRYICRMQDRQAINTNAKVKQMIPKEYHAELKQAGFAKCKAGWYHANKNVLLSCHDGEYNVKDPARPGLPFITTNVNDAVRQAIANVQ